MTSTEKVHNIVFVIENGSEPKKCKCGSIHFFTRPKSKDAFSATYVDCIKCGDPHRIGGYVWIP
jgi:hypothetical protein